MSARHEKVSDPLRIGMQMAMPGGYDRIFWYGRGPHESYWDRKESAAVGVYHRALDDFGETYVRPQENGNRTDVRWIAFENSDGEGVLITGRPVFNASAWPYTQEELEAAGHIHELPRHEGLMTVNIDHQQQGAGGQHSWGTCPLDKYRLTADEYEYEFVLSPLGRDVDREELYRHGQRLLNQYNIE